MTLTPEQIEERKSGLGGSDALAYAGKDPRKTPLALWQEKTGKSPAAAPVEERTPNTRPGWGSRLEPLVRDWMSEELGRPIHTTARLYRSTELPFMIAHPDGMTMSPMEGVEIKTADRFMAQEFGEVETDQVPIRYVLQVTHYMIVMRLRRFHLGALIGGNDARHYVIDYDDELAQMLTERARAFWHLVESDTPPDPVTLADTTLRWPTSHGRTVVANESIAHAVGELKKMRLEESEIKAKADATEVMLKAYMGDAGGLIDAHHHLLATWRTQSQNRFNIGAFSEAYPDLAAQYRKLSEYRVFRLK